MPVDGDITILDIILRNFAAVGLRRAVVVVGHAADAIRQRRAELAARYGLDLELVANDRPQWNNCYSLWLARDAFAEGAMLVNGDTVHPVEVEQTLLARRGARLLLAVDVDRPLTGEAMKVLLDGRGRPVAISKELAPAEADGEYLGAALIEPAIAGQLSAALAATWRADPTLFYEHGYQALLDSGADVRVARLPALPWVEVDDAADLAVARGLACHY
jgi:choline kinase